MRRWGYGLAGLLALVVIAGIASPETATQETPSSSHTQTAEPTESAQSAESTPAPAQPAATTAPQDCELAALLTQLVIEDEFPSGYDRDLFQHWIDADRDGCDARREVLILEAALAPTVGEGC